MQGEIKDLPLDLVRPPETDVRQFIIAEGLEALAESIKQQGVLQPIIVRSKDGKYEIVVGHRRYLASKIANQATIPVIVQEKDEKLFDFMKLHENYNREGINPVDEAIYFQKLTATYSLSLKELAEQCARSTDYISSRLGILEGDEQVRAALQGEVISISQAKELNKVIDPAIRQELLRITVESGATVRALRMMRMDYEGLTPQSESEEVSDNGQAVDPKTIQNDIKCPICLNSFPYREIIPLSMCKGCYRNIVNAMEAG